MNLYNIIAYTKNNILYFKTYDEYFAQAHEVIDITDRIIDNSLSIESMSKDLPRELIFEAEKCEDLSSLQYKEIKKKDVGFDSFISNTPYLSKRFKIGAKCKFAYRDFLQRDTRGATALAFAKGLRFISSNQDFSENGLSGAYVFYRNSAIKDTSNELILRLNGNIVADSVSYHYTQFSSYKKALDNTNAAESEIQTTDKNISWFFSEPVKDVEKFASTFEVQNSANLYNTYYKNMIEEMYNYTSKYVYCSIVMDVIEVLSINLWDRIRIDNSIFKVMSIKYNTSSSQANFKLIKV